MTLETILETELIDDKKQIFKRPSTKKEIFRERQAIRIMSFEDIVPALEERTENQVAIIYPNVNIIPTDKNGVPEYYSAQNFSKRGPLVKLETFGKQESVERQWSPIKARIQASKEYKDLENNFVGWYWRDPEGYFHIVQPWMVLEGRRLEMLGQLTGNINYMTKIVKTYSARDSQLRTIKAKVPSRSERKEHEVVMEHLTNVNDTLQYIEWTRFSTRHSCSFKTFDFGFRFPKSVTYCPHDIAAYVAYSRKIAKEKGRIILQPFPMFREAMLRLYLSLIYDTLKIDITPEGKTKTRTLTFPEINPILMDAWLRYGNFNTFYVPAPTKGYKTMRDYNWNLSASGMKFRENSQ